MKYFYISRPLKKKISAVLQSWESRAPSRGQGVQGQKVGLCSETTGQGVINAHFFCPTCIKLLIVLHNLLASGLGVVTTFFAKRAKLM